MKIEATFKVIFKITDRTLYEEMEENDSAVVEFLTALNDSIRYSEDWTKRFISVESDELWWNDDTDTGEIEVMVMFDLDFGDDEDWAVDWIQMLKDTFEVDLPEDPNQMEPIHFINLVKEPVDGKLAGPIHSIIRWGSLISEDEDGGCFLEPDSEAGDMYRGSIENLSGPVFHYGSFEDFNGNEYDITGGDTPDDYYVEQSN